MTSSQPQGRRPGGQMDPAADRLIREAAKRQLRDVGYARMTIDGVAREAGVARTTIYRRYADKAELVSAAIDSLRQPAKAADTGDAQQELVAQLDNARRHFDMSLAGTLLMEEPHDPRLIGLFRERMVLPRRAILRDIITRGIERGQIRADVDVEPVLDLVLGALFAAVMAAGRPAADWPRKTVDAMWPALAERASGSGRS